MTLRRLLLLPLLLLSAPAWAQTVQPISLELHTTSDDIEVTFAGLDVRVLRSTVESTNGASQVNNKPLHVKKQPWDTTPVTLLADLLVTPTDVPLAVKVARGCPGETRLILRAAGKIALE